MTEPVYNDAVLEESTDNKKQIWIIVAIVLVLLCCCFVLLVSGAVWLWYNGDELLGLTANLLPLLLG